MYSKTRNTLTAVITASLFLASGWMFGRPVDAASRFHGIGPASAPMGIDTARLSLGPSVLHAHHATRMSLAMPYYSFSLATSERRAD